MTDGPGEHLPDERIRRIAAGPDLCVAAAIGPDGDLDAILTFGGLQITEEGSWRFPLRAIEEGSFLRAWLRISRYTGRPVPWTMLCLDRRAGESVLVQGGAHLMPGVSSSTLLVELTPHDLSTARHLTLSPATVTVQAEDSALRGLAAEPATTLTEPATAFLARGTEAYLCAAGTAGRPVIQAIGVAEGRPLTAGPEITLDGRCVYVRRDSGTEGLGAEALLLVPNFGARLAVRIGGPATMLDGSALPAAVANHLTGASAALAIAVATVYVQAGDWSAPEEPAEGGGNLRVAAGVLRVHGARSAGRAEVSFVGGPSVLARGGESLLELAEANGVPMEAGCRMGICGADPVRITAGEENLSRVRRSEQSTLDRLGLPPGCRMACSARVQGPVTVASVDDAAPAPAAESDISPVTPSFPLDPTVQRVVVIGTGIAGISAVEEVRKHHPAVEIALLGAEPYDFYNRMAISRLVDDETTPEKLNLMTADWARRRRVLYQPGVVVAGIDRERREVVPAAGSALPYDRLVLATGARSRIPRLEGIDLPGTFALRTLDDALAVRRQVHRPGLRRAVIVGAGLLGLEAAYHLVQTGLRVWVVGRGEWPANRQLDRHAGELLSQMLQDLGIEYLRNSEPRRLVGGEWLEGVELVDGRLLSAGLCLVAAGIVPEVELARAAGLEVVQGVVVDDHMRTSDPAIYAAGDLIEYRGRTFGLWPASVDQAVVAATNLLGGDLAYHATMAPAQLKVPGIDLLSVGEIAPRTPEEREIRIVDPHERRYRKVVVRGERAIGAVLIGSPELFDGVADAVQGERDLGGRLEDIERGDWSALSGDEAEDDLHFVPSRAV